MSNFTAFNTLKSNWNSDRHSMIQNQHYPKNLPKHGQQSQIHKCTSFEVILLTLSFGVIKYTDTDQEDLNRTIRASTTRHRIQHSKEATKQITLPLNLGGMWILDVKQLHFTQIANLSYYFLYNSNQIKLFKVICETDVIRGTPLKLVKNRGQKTLRETLFKLGISRIANRGGLVVSGVRLTSTRSWFESRLKHRCLYIYKAAHRILRKKNQ